MPRRRHATNLRMLVERVALASALLLASPVVSASLSGCGTGFPQFGTVAKADDDGPEGGGGGGGTPGGGGGTPGGGPSAGEGGGGGGNMWQPGRGRNNRPARASQRFYWPWEQPPRRVRAATQRRPPARVVRAPPPVRQPADALAREVVVIGLDPAGLASLRGSGFAVLGERTSALVPNIVVRLRIPRRLSMENAIARVRTLVPGAVVARNQLFRQSYRTQAGSSAMRRAFADPHAMIGWPAATACVASVGIGIVDTGVTRDLPIFAGRALTLITARSEGRAPSSASHGTSVAALLVGDGTRPGLLPEGRIVAIDAFHRRDGADVADAFDIVAAFTVAADQGVGVVNVSFAGPENAVLDAAGRALAARGIRVVAAAGNDGARSAPRYPAAYEWAVAATAIDESREVYGRAVRGNHIAFAAPGVRIRSLLGDGRPGVVTGTSFAAPYVTAALALVRASRPAEPALDQLVQVAEDLGAPGRDAVFGHGLLRLTRGCP